MTHIHAPRYTIHIHSHSIFCVLHVTKWPASHLKRSILSAPWYLCWQLSSMSIKDAQVLTSVIMQVSGVCSKRLHNYLISDSDLRSYLPNWVSCQHVWYHLCLRKQNSGSEMSGLNLRRGIRWKSDFWRLKSNIGAAAWWTSLYNGKCRSF